MRKLSILGSTGSIGKQTLEVARKAPSDFTVEALSCESDIDTLFDQIKEFRPRVCSVVDEQKAIELGKMLQSAGIETEVLSGSEGNITCATLGSCDTVVGAIVGFAGLEPVYHGVLAGKDIALANKETLVAGGDVIMPLIREKGVKMHKPRREKSLEDTVQAALRQIEEKKYREALVEKGFAEDRIRAYGFAFQGKKVLIVRGE